MASKHVHKQLNWTAEDRARHQAIRERFKNRPSVQELIDTQEIAGDFTTQGEYLEMVRAVAVLKQQREAAGLSLAEVSRRSGIDAAALSRLENGRNQNPTLETLGRYARALGKRLTIGVQDEIA